MPNVLSLPLEILQEICGLFVPPPRETDVGDFYSFRGVNFTHDWATLRSASLACRGLRDAAQPLLFSIFHVPRRGNVLRFLLAIARSKHLAACVRRAVVTFDYDPELDTLWDDDRIEFESHLGRLEILQDADNSLRRNMGAMVLLLCPNLIEAVVPVWSNAQAQKVRAAREARGESPLRSLYLQLIGPTSHNELFNLGIQAQDIAVNAPSLRSLFLERCDPAVLHRLDFPLLTTLQLSNCGLTARQLKEFLAAVVNVEKFWFSSGDRFISDSDTLVAGYPSPADIMSAILHMKSLKHLHIDWHPLVREYLATGDLVIAGPRETISTFLDNHTRSELFPFRRLETFSTNQLTLYGTRGDPAPAVVGRKLPPTIKSVRLDNVFHPELARADLTTLARRSKENKIPLLTQIDLIQEPCPGVSEDLDDHGYRQFLESLEGGRIHFTHKTEDRVTRYPHLVLH